MTISLPPSKVKKILKCYFSGLSQSAIAEKLLISQGSVSHWVSRFNEEAIKNGLLSAAKEFSVLEEIVELRALSVELEKGGMTTKGAGVGVKIMKKFKKLGVDPAQHEELVEVCAQVKDPGFVESALKLHEIKLQSGLDYNEAIVKCEKTTQEITVAEAKLEKTKAELQDTTTKVEEKAKKINNLQNSLDKLSKAVEERLKALKKEVANKEKEAKVTQKEIKQVAVLKADLAKQGLDIPTLVKLAKEMGHGENPD